MHYLYRLKAANFPTANELHINNVQLAVNELKILQNDPQHKENSPFPPVNISQFNTSAKEYEQLLKEAQLLIDKIITSSDFARSLMHEAQLSKQKEVDDLIVSAGIKLKVKTTYNPSGIQFEIHSQEYDKGCCQLKMNLRW